jgi:hypothetical protein
MRVRCVNIVNPITGEQEEMSSWVQIGREYVVLEVTALPGRRVSVRIITDEGSPGLWDSVMFETVDSSVPSNWVVQVVGDGWLEMGPARWLVRGFWEEYYDREPGALSIYDDELGKILQDSDPGDGRPVAR